MILLEYIFKRYMFEDAVENSIALVPGSFRPPHAGHLDMVKQYSKMANKVVVIISNPKTAVRKTATGKVISPEVAKKIWEIYIKALHLKNVEIVISKDSSPVSAAFGYVKELDGGNVIFGSSTKDEDYKRWSRAKDYFEKNNPSITVIDPKKVAVKPFEGISATDIRNNIDKPEEIRKYFPKELSDTDYKKIIKLLQ